ncbi:MAG: 3-hydroxyacyl-CoA dehydrogenase NAD-binding domain-containing protein, partial [Pseudomonadota bacterium]
MAFDIKTIGVIGAGQMGAGIAQVSAAAGYSVILTDVSLDNAKAAIE